MNFRSKYLIKYENIPVRFVVGQNIAYTFSKTAESMTQFWFDEYLITPQSLINNMTEIEVFVKLSGEMKK